LQIQQNDVRLESLEAAHCLFAIQHDLGLITRNIKHMPEQGHNIPIIFHDKRGWFAQSPLPFQSKKEKKRND
jgi:hypothetical protein